MSDPTPTAVENCPGCRPPTPATPLPAENRPGLNWLAFRVGTFATFRQAMLDRLLVRPVVSEQAASPTVLTTREPDDFAVAMLDLWAYVCDVLGVYQEAYLNEGFLRTAQLRESLENLGRLTGYRAAPGVSATVWLAFQAEPSAIVELPARWGVQSTPPPGAEAAVFETTAPLIVHHAANSPGLLGTPTPATWRTTARLLDDAHGPPVVAGTRLAFYRADARILEQRVVTRVTANALGRIVEWSGALNDLPAAETRVSRLGRSWRLFGVHAPHQYLSPVNGSDPLKFAVATTSFVESATQVLSLDGAVSGLAAGTRLLLHYVPSATPRDLPVDSPERRFEPGWMQEVVVRGVTSASKSRGPLSGACTEVECDTTIAAVLDARRLTVYELIGEPLEFSTLEYGPTLAAADAAVYVTDAAGLRPGQRVLIARDNWLHAATVTAAPIPCGPSRADGSPRPPFRAPIAPPLPGDIPVTGTNLHGNVVTATHGESRGETVLGDGDASQVWQEFRVSTEPLTFVADPRAPGGAASTLELFVDGRRWEEAPSFFGRGPDESIYVTYFDDRGRLWVRGGDGRTGRRFPSGRDNLRVRFRQGTGAAGNTPAATIDVLLKGLPGLKGVTNPGPARGGDDAEPAESLRRNSPTEILTLGRAVSLRDYENLTLSYLRGGKARASWAEVHGRRGVVLACRPAGGSPLAEVSAGLREFLDRRRDANCPLTIREARKIPYVWRAMLHLAEGVSRSRVRNELERSFGVDQGYLSFAQTPIGRTVHLSALVARLQAVEGVEWVEVSEFSTPQADRAFGARPEVLDAVYVGPDEIAWPALDGDLDHAQIDVSLIGGVDEGGFA